MLACKGLRSPHHSARIVSIDTSKAEAHPGVFAVATYKDMPKNTVGHLEALGVPADEPYLAEGEVRYKGQLIGGVAAIDEATALEALDLIDVKYEVREPFLDIRRAFDPDVPQLTDKGNVFFYDPYDHRKVTKGDVDAAFEKADVIVKGCYRPGAIEQAPIEPQGCLVVPESDGRLTRVRAIVPEAEMYKYSTNLHSITHGRGTHRQKFHKYAEAPPEVSAKVAEENQKGRELQTA
jgi:CO/xanthine dehydrogenase Mo-binding subunit